MRRNILSIWICGLCALPVLARADAPVTKKADPQTNLQQCLTELKQMSQVDDTTRRFSPSIEAMLRHVLIRDLPATQSEKQIADIFLGEHLDDISRIDGNKPHRPYKNTYLMKTRGGGGSGLGFKVVVLKGAIQKMPGLNPKPRFVVVERVAPLTDRKMGCVNVFIGARSNALVDVSASAGAMSVMQRANSIKKKLETLAAADPLFWTRLSVGQVNNQYVVSSPSAEGGYIITADAKFARMRNCAPQQLAEDLIAGIRNTFDPAPTKFTRGLPDYQGRSQAEQLFDKGNAADDPKTAEEDFKQAIQSDPDFVAAYEALGTLYTQQHRTQDAQDIADALVARMQAKFGQPAQPRGVRAIDFAEMHRQTVQLWEQGNDAFARGDQDTAEADYKQVIQAEPNYIVAYKSLAAVYLARGDKAQARDLLNKALALKNLDAEDAADINKALRSLK